MKYCFWKCVVALTICSNVVVIGGDDCKWALDPRNTCTQTSTANCPSGCNLPAGSGGTEFSGETVYAQIAGGSGVSDGSEDKNCSRTVTCSALRIRDNYICDNHVCVQGESTNVCSEQTPTIGTWSKAASAKVKPCPSNS
jgi:hypothetical protein